MDRRGKLLVGYRNKDTVAGRGISGVSSWTWWFEVHAKQSAIRLDYGGVHNMAGSISITVSIASIQLQS